MVNNNVNPCALTKNNFLIKRHLDDKLIVNYLGTKLVSSIIQIHKWMAGRLFTFTDPVLFIQGDCDKESDLGQTQMVYEKVASREKDLEVI